MVDTTNAVHAVFLHNSLALCHATVSLLQLHKVDTYKINGTYCNGSYFLCKIQLRMQLDVVISCECTATRC